MLKSCVRFNVVRSLILLTAVMLAGSRLPAAEFAPAGAVDVPDWALGVLSFRQLGGSLEKTGAYANNLLPNSAELAKQIIMGGLFKLPINAGVKNGAAFIFALDPLIGGAKDEMAFILPVGDAATLTKAFVETYGAPAEKDGVMTFALPQPIPQPDKMLLAKAVKDRLLVGPNEQVLKKLESYVEGKTDAMLTGKGTSDATLDIKIPNVKRVHGAVADLLLVLLAQMSGPARAEQGRAAGELLQKIWQLDVLEVRLELNADGTNGTLEFLGVPLKGSPLAAQLATSGKPVAEGALRLMPENSALFGTWNVNGQELLKSYKPLVPAGEDAASKASAELETALSELIKMIDGSASVAIALAPDNSPVTLIGVQSGNGKAFHDAVKGLWQKWQAVVKEASRGGEQRVQWKFKDSSESYAGTTIQSFQASAEGLDAEQQSVIQSAAGWPPTIRHALVGEKALFSIGKDGLDAMKMAIDREKTGLAQAAELVRGTLASEPRFVGAITTTNLARLVFGNLKLAQKISLERLTKGLTDTPIAISGKADTFLYLRAEVPVAAADAVGTIFQRLQGVNLRLESTTPKGGDAPAPPPPP